MKGHLSRVTRETVLAFGIALVLVAATGRTVLGQVSSSAFSFADRGGISRVSSGTAVQATTGYSRIDRSGAYPMGLAIFGPRQNNALVSETTVPAADLAYAGRIYAEIGGAVNTGVAIANPNDQFVTVSFYFTDGSGRSFGTGSTVIPPNGQIARFLNEAPFNGGTSVFGTFTFRSTLKVAAIALRGFANERSEFLMTTLPVAPLEEETEYFRLLTGANLPHFAAGDGWTTQLVFVNQTDQVLTGTVFFTDPNGQSVTVDTDLGSSNRFSYRVLARSAWRLRTSVTGTLRMGSVLFLADAVSTAVPVGSVVFSYKRSGVTVSEAGVPPPRSMSAARLFVEVSGDFGRSEPGSLQTGFAISNATSSAPVRVTLDLTGLDSRSMGRIGTIDIPAGGQASRFLNQIPGFESLPVPFQGVLRVTAPSASVTVVGLRGRYNERQDFLVTTIPPVNEDDFYFSQVLHFSDFLFPHFPDGGGYTTQFVLFSGWTVGAGSGALRFFTNAGTPFPLTLTPR